MMGGFHKKDNIEQSDRDMVANHTNDITVKLGNHGKAGSTYNINEVYTQVVAGTNYFFRLTSDGGQKVHVAIHKPLPHTGQPSYVHDADVGHEEAPHFHH